LSDFHVRFMESLRWVDQTYVIKHKQDDPKQLRAMYYPNMRQYPIHGDTAQGKTAKEAGIKFLVRYGRKAGISLAVYLLSYLPYVGRFVLPAASFYTFNKSVGPQPAIIIFGSSIFLPRRYLVTFLQSYFASRSLMRELVCFVLVTIAVPRLTSPRSSNHTLPASTSTRSRKRRGFTIVKVSSLASAWASLSFSRSLCLVSSSTALQKPRPLSSSQKSRILLHHPSSGRTMSRARCIGRTSTTS